MDPAVLADLVSRVHVDPLTGVQSLDQLAAELSAVSLVVAFAFKLRQSLACAADHEVTHSYPLTAQPQRVECFAYGLRLGDRVASMTGRHPSQCSTEEQHRGRPLPTRRGVGA